MKISSYLPTIPLMGRYHTEGTNPKIKKAARLVFLTSARFTRSLALGYGAFLTGKYLKASGIDFFELIGVKPQKHRTEKQSLTPR